MSIEEMKRNYFQVDTNVYKLINFAVNAKILEEDFHFTAYSTISYLKQYGHGHLSRQQQISNTERAQHYKYFHKILNEEETFLVAINVNIKQTTATTSAAALDQKSKKSNTSGIQKEGQKRSRKHDTLSSKKKSKEKVSKKRKTNPKTKTKKNSLDLDLHSTSSSSSSFDDDEDGKFCNVQEDDLYYIEDDDDDKPYDV